MKKLTRLLALAVLLIPGFFAQCFTKFPGCSVNDPGCRLDLVGALLLSTVTQSRYYYVPAQGTKTVSVFSVNQVTGLLNQIQSVSLGFNFPLGACIDSTNRFLFVVNSAPTGPIQTFSIDAPAI